MANSKQNSIGIGNKQEITNILVDQQYFDRLILTKYPSIIDQVVVLLFQGINGLLPAIENVPLYTPEDKIEHNNVVKFKESIYAYGEYTQFLESAYDALESDTPGRKNRLLFYIRSEYLKIVGRLVAANTVKQRIEIIRENADDIIEEIINGLLVSVAGSKSVNQTGIAKEELIVCINTVVCHAFVECKILENPNL